MADADADAAATAAERPAVIVHPCTACRQLRRGCRPDCIFAPCFPPSQPNRFAVVRRVYGAGNVQRLLEGLPPEHRRAAADALAYEASMRLRDRVFGAAGIVSLYEHQLHGLQLELLCARAELSTYECSNRSNADEEGSQMIDLNFLGVCGHSGGGGGGGWGDGWHEAMRIEGCVSEARIAARLAAATDAAVVSIRPVEDRIAAVVSIRPVEDRIAATATATATARRPNRIEDDAVDEEDTHAQQNDQLI